MSLRIGVLMGGFSSEREVSLNSGAAVIDALTARGHRAEPIDVRRDLPALIAALDPPPDAVFNALHGRYGEDGAIQGLLDIMGIPYTHSGRLASAIAMDKPTAKTLFRDAGIPVPEHAMVSEADWPYALPLAPPFAIKPADDGSSVGVRIVRTEADLAALGEVPWDYGARAMVEVFVPGREITVAVMDGKALGVMEIRHDQDFYDYTAKYASGGSDHIVPAPMPEADYAAAMRIAETAHAALGCRGVTRADLRFDDSRPAGEPRVFLLELNTQPGLTATSLVPDIARFAGIEFPQLIDWMVETATCDG